MTTLTDRIERGMDEQQAAEKEADALMLTHRIEHTRQLIGILKKMEHGYVLERAAITRAMRTPPQPAMAGLDVTA